MGGDSHQWARGNRAQLLHHLSLTVGKLAANYTRPSHHHSSIDFFGNESIDSLGHQRAENTCLVGSRVYGGRPRFRSPSSGSNSPIPPFGFFGGIRGLRWGNELAAVLVGNGLHSDPTSIRNDAFCSGRRRRQRKCSRGPPLKTANQRRTFYIELRTYFTLYRDRYRSIVLDKYSWPNQSRYKY